MFGCNTVFRLKDIQAEFIGGYPRFIIGDEEQRVPAGEVVTLLYEALPVLTRGALCKITFSQSRKWNPRSGMLQAPYKFCGLKFTITWSSSYALDNNAAVTTTYNKSFPCTQEAELAESPINPMPIIFGTMLRGCFPVNPVFDPFRLCRVHTKNPVDEWDLAVNDAVSKSYKRRGIYGLHGHCTHVHFKLADAHFSNAKPPSSRIHEEAWKCQNAFAGIKLYNDHNEVALTPGPVIMWKTGRCCGLPVFQATVGAAHLTLWCNRRMQWVLSNSEEEIRLTSVLMDTVGSKLYNSAAYDDAAAVSPPIGSGIWTMHKLPMRVIKPCATQADCAMLGITVIEAPLILMRAIKTVTDLPLVQECEGAELLLGGMQTGVHSFKDFCTLDRSVGLKLLQIKLHLHVLRYSPGTTQARIIQHLTGDGSSVGSYVQWAPKQAEVNRNHVISYVSKSRVRLYWEHKLARAHVGMEEIRVPTPLYYETIATVWHCVGGVMVFHETAKDTGRRLAQWYTKKWTVERGRRALPRLADELIQMVLTFLTLDDLSGQRPLGNWTTLCHAADISTQQAHDALTGEAQAATIKSLQDAKQTLVGAKDEYCGLIDSPVAQSWTSHDTQLAEVHQAAAAVRKAIASCNALLAPRRSIQVIVVSDSESDSDGGG